MIGKLRDMCCSRKTADTIPSAHFTHAAPASQNKTQTLTQPLQSPVPPAATQQLCSAPAVSEPASTSAAAFQSSAQLAQQVHCCGPSAAFACLR